MPGARCTRGLMRNVHKECAHEHTGQRRQSDIPCAMALRLIARSPESRNSLATVAGGTDHQLDASISDVRTTRFCRTLSRRSLSALPASTATRPTFVAIMIRPSDRDGMATDIPCFSLLEKRNIFYFGA